MKKIKDTEIEDRVFYYLLDFIDTHQAAVFTIFEKVSLAEMTAQEIKVLFSYAKEIDVGLL